MKKFLLVCVMFVLFSANAFAQRPGDWVLGKWRGGAYWFPGVVQSSNGKSVTIAYDDGTRETVSPKQVRPYNWKPGSRIECRWAGGQAWYGANITRISKDGTKLDVKYDDGVSEKIATGGCRSR
jgi:hypothetical protein